VYAVPPQRGEDALLLAVRRRAASVHITDRSGPNPYDELPAEALRRAGQGRGQGLRPASSDPDPAGWTDPAGATGNGDPPVPGSGHRGARGTARRWRVPMVLAVLVLAVVAVAWTTPLLPGTGGGGQTCQRSFVPAFFSPGSGWTRIVRSKPPPAVMILDLTDTGAGTSPEPGFQAAVRRAQAAGIRVLGYVATEYGQRPIAQAEADARNYKAWYGVSGIFLDQTPASRAQLGYYRSLADYIRGISRGAVVWLNPGIYPDQAYMSVADVVMTFEGPYTRYRNSRAPGWASQYPPGRFANTIFAASSAEFESALRQSAGAIAGYVFITDRSGTDPYSGLPAYWANESASVAASCTGRQ
jgi:Spherulation-specific family 4